MSSEQKRGSSGRNLGVPQPNKDKLGHLSCFNDRTNLAYDTQSLSGVPTLKRLLDDWWLK